MSSVPCKRCYSKQLKCKLMFGSCCYRECNRSNVSCAIYPLSENEQNRLKKAKDKLKDDICMTCQAKEEALQLLLTLVACKRHLERHQETLNDRATKMLQCDVDSLEELEELERLEAEAAEKAKSSLSAFDPYSFLLDVDFPFDLQTLASLEAPQASQGSGSRTLPVPSSFQPGSSQVPRCFLNIGTLPILPGT